jgi:hypothetical protein
MSDDDKKRQQMKAQMQLEHSQIALKHMAAMEEIEQKGRAQAGTHIIKGIVDQMDPESKANALATLGDTFGPGGTASGQQGNQAAAQGAQQAPAPEAPGSEAG